MTRTVADSALMLTVMNEPDARDWYAVPGDGADLRRACTASVKGWRIAYSPLLGNRSVHPEVAALVKAAAEALVDLEIGRAHVCTPVTKAQLVCRLLLDKQKTTT